MKEILIATRNQHKFLEMVSILKELDKNSLFDFLNLNDIKDLPNNYDVLENAMFYEGNAIIKAIHFGKKTGLITLADDSGLEVEALNGRPGVHSARYINGTDEDRSQKILTELENIKAENYKAKYVCVMAIYNPETEKIKTCLGEYAGLIIKEFKGKNGFGYDPVFYNEQLKKTNAEMTQEEKNKVSHRRVALEKIYKELINI